MSQNRYRIYENSVRLLASSLVIKSNFSAVKINELLSYTHPSCVVSDDRSTWKYFLNLCGVAHETDPEIKVKSLDTQEEILFNKENLKVHIATRSGYYLGGRLLDQLIAQYPEHRQLILGALYPAQMSALLSAPDCTIVAYPKELIEENETQLIPEINQWINNYRGRWYNIQFNLTDTLYEATFLGGLYYRMVPLIMNLRLKACRSRFAHSFHITEYLASHGKLDGYMGKLNKKQALFFYRNVAFIERNNGKVDTFNWLVDNIMTERGLPIAEVSARHDTSAMGDYLRPDIFFRKKQINTVPNTNENTRVSLSDIIELQKPLALENTIYGPETESRVYNTLQLSQSSVVQTKILDSSINDYNNTVGATITELALQYWLHLSYNNLYNVFISFKNPRTSEILSVPVKTGFIYLFYVFCKANNVEVKYIPSFTVFDAMRLSEVSDQRILSVTSKEHFTVEDAQWLKSTQPEFDNIYSVSAFAKLCSSVQYTENSFRRFIGYAEDGDRRGYAVGMVKTLYEDRVYQDENTGIRYDDWLDLNHLPRANFSRREYLELYTNVFTAGTGIDPTVFDAAGDLLLSMVSLFAQLSSYSVQFITNAALASNMRTVDWAPIRISPRKTTDTDLHVYKNFPITAEVHKTTLGSNHHLPSTEVRVGFTSSMVNTEDLTYDPTITAEYTGENSNHATVFDIAHTVVSVSDPTDKVDRRQRSVAAGYDSYMELSMDIRTWLRDIYCLCLENPNDKGIDISKVIYKNKIDAFKYYRHHHTLISGFTYPKIKERQRAYNHTRTHKRIPGLILLSGDPVVLDQWVGNFGESEEQSYSKIKKYLYLVGFNLWESTDIKVDVMSPTIVGGGHDTSKPHLAKVIQLPGISG